MPLQPPDESAPAPSASGRRGLFSARAREFWRGLTTPRFGVVLAALGWLMLALVLGEVLARKSWLAARASPAVPAHIRDHFARASVLALQGARRQAPGPEPTLLFVGPSALRLWLPDEAESADVLAKAERGPVRVITMCGNAQSYALTAALIERFGTDFDGWIVIGVDRQMIGRSLNPGEAWLREVQSQRLGFESALFRTESEFLGVSQPKATGFALRDRRSFNRAMGFGRASLAIYLRGETSYLPHDIVPGPYDPARAAKSLSPLSVDGLDRHLAVLERLVARVRAAGRAKVALVETPWIDDFAPELKTPEWEAEEAAYAKKMHAWSQAHGVPWLTGAAAFALKPQDFVDTRHVGSAEARREFVLMVAKELLVAAP